MQIDSENCELLLRFTESQNLVDLSRRLGRDISVISRRLQKLAEMAPVIEKNQGRWQITPLGTELVRWSREASLSQAQLLERPRSLKIATNPEFSARVLAPALPLLAGQMPATTFQLLSADRGTEAALLKGDIDLAIDCGRPASPDIRFRLLTREQFSLVASPKFLREHKLKKESDFLPAPHLEFTRLRAARYLKLQSSLAHTVASFSDIASCRAAAVAGFGWALLPHYAVKEELENGKLLRLNFFPLEHETYGLWWLRGRKSLAPYLKIFEAWLETVKL